MRNLDEEIQKSLERGDDLRDERLEVKAYKRVFKALSHDPGYTLPTNFADRVVSRLSPETRPLWEYILFGLGFLIIAGASAWSILETGVLKINLGFLPGFTSLRWLFLFGFVFIGLLHWIDKRFVLHQKT